MDWRRETLGTEKPVPRPVQDPSVGVQRAWTWVLVLGAERREGFGGEAVGRLSEDLAGR